MIPPITGMLRKRFLLDVSTALAIGTSAGYAFWYMHLRRVEKQESYYLKLERAKQQEQ